MMTRSSRGIPAVPPDGTVDPQGWVRLSPSERLVLEMLASGLAPKQVAWERGVSIATVRTQIASAKRKTGARTLPQLVSAFAELGTSAQTADADSRIPGSIKADLP